MRFYFRFTNSWFLLRLQAIRGKLFGALLLFEFLFLFWTDTFGHPVEGEEGNDEQDDLEDQDGDGDVGSVVHRYRTVHK